MVFEHRAPLQEGLRRGGAAGGRFAPGPEGRAAKVREGYPRRPAMGKRVTCGSCRARGKRCAFPAAAWKTLARLPQLPQVRRRVEEGKSNETDKKWQSGPSFKERAIRCLTRLAPRQPSRLRDSHPAGAQRGARSRRSRWREKGGGGDGCRRPRGAASLARLGAAQVAGERLVEPGGERLQLRRRVAGGERQARLRPVQLGLIDP